MSTFVTFPVFGRGKVALGEKMHPMALARLGLLLVAWTCACSKGTSGPAADWAIDNGRIWTGDPGASTFHSR